MKTDRYCNYCGIVKHITQFYTASYKCKECIKIIGKNLPKIDWHTDIILLDNEKWIPITGYEQFHEISNFGRISALQECKNHTFYPLKERKILRPPINPFTGYIGHVFAKWGIHEKEKRCNIHRLVAIHFISNEKNLPEVNHINGNKLDNFASNLEWVSRSENIVHAFNKGLMISKIGADNKNSKLTNDIVLEIFTSPIGPRELSRRLGIAYSLVAQIKNGSKWSHVTGGRKHD